jgi:hypothetical protein
MRRNQRRLFWLGTAILGVLTLSPALLGQASPDSGAVAPVPTDWSHHHVIFSRPATAEQAKRVQQDPRYWQQIARHSPRLPASEMSGALVPELQRDVKSSRSGKKGQLSRDWSEDIGSGASVGAGNYPAKYSFNTSQANCGDFAVYTTSVFGSSQASIVAYDNLYSGCSSIGPVPTVYWAFTTGAKILTSPVFSSDGTQIAFVQSNSLSHGILVLLKWAASTTESVTSPATLTRVSHAAYLTCTAPCMTTATLTGSVLDNDTNSSVFYDYNSDTAYVGDDAGWLHKFTPVFDAALTEVRTGGWPVQVNPTTPTALTDPVYDSSTGNVFVEDKGGYLYWVNSATPTPVTQSGQLDFSTADDSGPGFVQGPIVDSTAGLVYAFATSDGTANTANCALLHGAQYACAAVYLLTTSFASGTTGSKAKVGSSTVSGTTPNPLYIGAFDSTYENSVDPPTGNLYVCGNTGGNPILYQVPITAGAFGTVNAGPVLTGLAVTPCSPVTDIFNPNTTGGATEWMFASVEAGGISSGCADGGCIFNFKDTPWKPSTAYTAGQEVLDSNFQIQVVTVAGTSGATAPAWSTTPGNLTLGDGTVVWLDQGVQTAFITAWAPNTAYHLNNKILDSNGNVQLVTIAGTSGGSMPTFNSMLGGITIDGTSIPPLTWKNVGVPATAAMATAGGTSGIILDNTVSSGTEPGASQIYFSTLNGGCGTDGCAVQASQSALQ